MRIDVYSAPALDTCLESIEWAGTFEAYMDREVPNWREVGTARILVYHEGTVWPPERWGEPLPSDSVLRVNTVPMGGIFKALGNIIGKLFSFLGFGSRGGSSSSETPQSRELKASEGRANTAKLGSVVSELAGTYRVFPSYLTPPRRKFINKREQWLYFHLNVGPGRYSVPPETVKVGDTPFGALGALAAYGIHEPNTDLSSVEAAQIWHTASVVGGTSSGTAGLEMTTEPANRTNTDPASYVIGGDIIARADGEFPSGWGAGTIVNVEYSRPYTIVDHAVPPTETEPGYTISRFTGYFGHVTATINISTIMQVGAFDSSTQWRVATVVSSAGGGVYTLEFRDSVTDAPIRVAPGTTAYIFGANRARTIVLFDPLSITVSPGSFQGNETISTRVRFAGGAVYGEWSSEFIATPPGVSTTLIELDVFFPQGLCYLSDEGDVESRSVGVEYQYRNSAGGPRVTISRSFSDATVDQIGFTEQFAIPAMVPAVRVRRVGSQSTSTQIQDKVQWYGLKARLPDYWRYPNWTTMSVALRSGGKLGAQSENQINLMPTRILPTLQPGGTWGPAVPTRDITAFARHILLSAGLTDDDIDLEAWQALHAIWTARGETLDFLYEATTVKDALDTAFGAGMGEFSCGDGVIRPVREDVRSNPKHSYSPQNMKTGLRRSLSAHTKISDYDGVDVEYMDASTWSKETAQCRLPGDVGAKVQKLTLDGVTDRTRAWRIGMRRRCELFYRKTQYSFTTELDALNSEYLDFVALFGSDPGYGQSAMLTAIRSDGSGGAVLTSSEPLAWTPGAGHVVAYRRKDGTLAGPFVASPGATEYEVLAVIPLPWPVVSMSFELPHLYFGESTKFEFPALIDSVVPRSGVEVSVTAVNYDARVYAYDNQTPPA